MSDASGKQMVIDSGTELDGSIRSRSDVLIVGTVKGELEAPALTVDPAGSMRGMVRVDRLVSEGEISGEISARSVELSGKVGDHTVIRADTLEVRPSQPPRHPTATFGRCELHVGDSRATADRRDRVESLERQAAPTT